MLISTQVSTKADKIILNPGLTALNHISRLFDIMLKANYNMNVFFIGSEQLQIHSVEMFPHHEVKKCNICKYNISCKMYLLMQTELIACKHHF